MRIPLISAGFLFGAQIAGAQQTTPATIVYRVAPAAATVPLAVVAQPRLDLGASGEDAETFDRISFVRRQSSGHIVVANRNPLVLRVFDSTGKYVRAIGRKGQGPGEFEEINAVVVRPGDSIAVLDRTLRRIVLLRADGAPISQIAFNPPFAGRVGNATLYSLGDGTLLIGYTESPPNTPSPTPIQLFENLGRYSSAGKLLNPVGKFLTGEYFVQVTGHTPPMSPRIAFWNLAFGKSGAMATAGSTLVAGDASALEVRRYSPAGAVQEIHRVALPPRAVTSADIDRYKRDVLGSAQPNERDVAQRRVDGMPYPKTLPAYRTILAEDRGRIWLQLYAFPTMVETHWMVLDPATKEAKTVRLPDRFTPHVVARGEIVGVWRDADGVEHVRAYRLAM